MLAFFDLNKHDPNNQTEVNEVYKAFCKIEDAIEFDEVLSKLFIDAKYKLEKEKGQFTLEELYGQFFKNINNILNIIHLYIECSVGDENSIYSKIYPLRTPKSKQILNYKRIAKLQKMLLSTYNLDSFTEEESRKISEKYPYFFADNINDNINALGKQIKEYEYDLYNIDQFGISAFPMFIDNWYLFDNYNHDMLRCETDEEAFKRICDVYIQLLNQYNKKKSFYKRIKFIIGLKIIGYLDSSTRFGKFLYKKNKRMYDKVYKFFFN